MAQPCSAPTRNLDLLRAVAVSCVFGAHLCLLLITVGCFHPGNAALWNLQLNELGHDGVLLFFVHTALVLMLSLERTKSSRLVLNFYIRRIFRIYPLSIICIAAILLFRIPQLPEVPYASWNWREIASNILLIQNVTHLPDMIMPLWTLPREFQMYLVLPFLYLLLKRFPSNVTVLLVWFGFFAAVPSIPLLSCFPCFMGGVLAYQLGTQRVRGFSSLLWPFAILLLLAGHAAMAQTIFPDYRPDYILCMFLGLVIPNVADLSKSWLTRASQAVAKYSYGIYLCHSPVIWFAFVKLAWLPLALRWAALVTMMVLVPVAAYRLLENPLIETGRRLAARWTAGVRPERQKTGGLFEAPSPQIAE